MPTIQEMITESYEETKHILQLQLIEQDINNELDLFQIEMLHDSNESYRLKTLFNGIKILTGFKQYTKIDDFIVARDPVNTEAEADSTPNTLDKNEATENTTVEIEKIRKTSEERIKKLQFHFKKLDKQFESRWMTRYNAVLNKKTIASLNEASSKISSSTQIEISSALVKTLGLKRTYGPLLTFATKAIVSKSSILKPDRYNCREILHEYEFSKQDTDLLEKALKSPLYKTDVIFKTDGEVSVLVAQPFKRDGRLNLLNAYLYKGKLKKQPEKTTAGVDSLSSTGVDHNTLAFYMSIKYEEYEEYYRSIIEERKILNGLLVSEYTRLEPRFIGIYFWYISTAYRFNTAKLSTLVMVLRDLKSIVSKLKI